MGQNEINEHGREVGGMRIAHQGAEVGSADQLWMQVRYDRS